MRIIRIIFLRGQGDGVYEVEMTIFIRLLSPHTFQSLNLKHKQTESLYLCFPFIFLCEKSFHHKFLTMYHDIKLELQVCVCAINANPFCIEKE